LVSNSFNILIMKNSRFLILGIFFAIVLSKTQAISWYRFYEMFTFQSFHMFGIIGGAVVISAIFMQLFKYGKIKDINGNKIIPKPKKKGSISTILGGTFFWIRLGYFRSLCSTNFCNFRVSISSCFNTITWRTYRCIYVRINK